MLQQSGSSRALYLGRFAYGLALGALTLAGCGDDSAPAPATPAEQSPDASCEGVEVLARDQRNATPIAINSTHVFWANWFLDEDGTSPFLYAILRAPLAGGPAEEVIRFEGLSGQFAVDDQNVYFLDCANADSGVGPCSVRQVPVGGGTPAVRIEPVFTTHAFLIRDGSVYFEERTIGGRLFRFAPDGGDAVVLTTGNDANPGGTAPSQLDVAGGFVYFAEGGNDPNSALIRKVSIDGGTVTTLAGPVGDSAGPLVVLGDRVYFAQRQQGDVERTVVRSVPIEGGEVQDGPALDLEAKDMVTDGAALYAITSQHNGPGGAVWRIDPAGGQPAMVDCGLRDGYSLAIDATHLYWSDTGSFTGAVFRKRK